VPPSLPMPVINCNGPSIIFLGRTLCGTYEGFITGRKEFL